MPFSGDFRRAAAITDTLRQSGPLGEVELTIDGSMPIRRPHRNTIQLGATSTDIHELTLIELPGLDGGTAGIGWFAHHDYKGAVPGAALVKGVRVRVGKIQIGNQTILEESFLKAGLTRGPWGEVHVLDRRIVSNGRRDGFEANAHYANLVDQLSPIGRDVARRCRTSSARRSKLREFELAERDATERLAVLNQGALSDSAHAAEIGRVFQIIARM